MPDPGLMSRRTLMQRLALSFALVPALASRAAPAAPLLAPDDAQAKALHYTEDARAEPAARGNSCATCALYQGADGSAQGPCQLFAGKEVKAAGWCSSWAPQM